MLVVRVSSPGAAGCAVGHDQRPHAACHEGKQEADRGDAWQHAARVRKRPPVNENRKRVSFVHSTIRAINCGIVPIQLVAAEGVGTDEEREEEGAMRLKLLEILVAT